MYKLAVVAGLTLCSGQALADGWPTWLPETAAVPFAFTSESIGNSLGFAGIMKGVGQPQAGLLASALYSDKGSYILYASANNYLLSREHRWIFGAEVYDARYQDNFYYVGAGNEHGSDLSQRTQTDGDEGHVRLSARYILPIGQGESGVLAGLQPQRAHTGYTPWTSGVTSLEFRPFYMEQKLANSPVTEPQTVWGLETILDWDNRNDVRNPSEGSRSRLHVHMDPGSDERSSWWKWEFNQSWYHNVGQKNEWLNRQVVAFNFYSANVPSWGSSDDGKGYHRPPDFAASRLGGLYRLRGYASGRYADKAALHYSLEYRVMPAWQPLSEWPVFNWYDVPWWQWVAFADVGRVADEYDLGTLHTDMQWSLGGAVRFQVEGIVVRTELAFSEQDSIFRVMVNQPF